MLCHLLPIIDSGNRLLVDIGIICIYQKALSMCCLHFNTTVLVYLLQISLLIWQSLVFYTCASLILPQLCLAHQTMKVSGECQFQLVLFIKLFISPVNQCMTSLLFYFNSAVYFIALQMIKITRNTLLDCIFQYWHYI